jgi:hypothetical protein
MDTTRKSLVDYISEEDYPRYMELLNKAEQAKANAPKAERKPRGPMTKEQQVKAAESRLAKAQAKLDALLAAQS